MQRDDDLITIAAFNTPIEAQMAQVTLEGQGIESFLSDEHIVSMNPLYSHAVGGVKVKVRLRDEHASREILFPQEPPVTARVPRARSNAFVKSKQCPSCRSEHMTFYGVTPYKLVMTAILVGVVFVASEFSVKALGGTLLFFGLLALIPGKYHTCHDCGARW